MFPGVLYNSGASGIEYMKPIWGKLTDLNLNTDNAMKNLPSYETISPASGKLSGKEIVVNNCSTGIQDYFIRNYLIDQSGAMIN